MALLLGALAAGLPAQGTLPDSVAAELPRLEAAQRRLDEATLGLAAARREAQAPQMAVDAARLHAGTVWGGWLLKRRLSELKAALDKVEAARAARVQAHAAVFALLSGVEEELRSQLETRARLGPDQLGWWRQEQAWSRRVEALERGMERAPLAAGPERSLLAEARQQQCDRDRAILARLRRQGLLGAAQARQDAARLDSAAREPSAKR